MRNKLLTLFCLIPLLAYAAVTITHPSGEVNTFASGSTLTVSGSFGGTPTGGTLSFANLAFTLPASQPHITPILGVATATSINAAKIRSGSGTPEGAVTGVVGELYLRLDGGANTTLYIKESGSGNTGWIAK